MATDKSREEDDNQELSEADEYNLAVQTDLEGELGERQRQARANVAAREPMTSELQAMQDSAIDYSKQYDDPDRQAVEDVDIMQAKREGDAKRAAAQSAASDPMSRIGRSDPVNFNGPGDVYRDDSGLHTGRFVTQEDYEAGEREIADIKRRQADNARLRRTAAANAEARRQQLLQQGYYDDGRGNLRQKKYNFSFRENRGNPQVSMYNQSRKTVGMDDIAAQSWDEAVAQQQKAQDAERDAKADAYTSRMIAANREAKKQSESEKALGESLRVKNRLAIFSAAAAALNDMRGKVSENGEVAQGDIFEPTKFAEKDAQGRVMGQNTNRQRVKTGGRFVVGGVMPNVLNELNDMMFARGNTDSKIVGITAQQAVDANGRVTGEPRFYIQRRLADGRLTGDWVTLGELYQFGLRNFEADKTPNAEDRVINAIGDVFGVRKNRPISEKLQIAQMQDKTKRDIAAARERVKYGMATMQEEGKDRRHLLKLASSATGGGQRDKFEEKIFGSFDTDKEAILNGREYSELSEDEKKQYNDVVRRQMAYRDRFVNGQREAENSAPPPQQRLVHYRDAQGTLKSGNGYVQGGKVYGADGRLIEGARETDRNGVPIADARVAAAKAEFAARKAQSAQSGKNGSAGKKVASTGGAAPSAATGTSGDGTAQTAQLDADGKPLDWPKLPAAGQGTGGGDYDTPLTEEEEHQFQEWRATLPKPLQYDGDYDLRGYWKDPDTQKMGIQDGAHFTDKYKKPNHPTFSNESQYATGENAKKAGRWDGDRFVPPQRTEPTLDANARKKELRRNNAEAVKEKRFQQFYKKFAIETEDGSITHTISEEEARKRFEREEEKLRKKREEQAENRRMAAELFKKTQ